MDRTRGLPETKKMRHDSHFVDRLTARPSDKVGEHIPIDQIDPNPHQPRRTMEGIRELVASIQENGVLEPILVRRIDERFEIVAGERRFLSAQEAGLSRIPCIVLDVDDRGCLEISLVENVQRRDLLPFDEADAMAQLKHDFGYTHEQIARKLGRSRSSVSETLALATVPAGIRKQCERAGLRARSALIQIARLSDEGEMQRLIDTAGARDLSRDGLREVLRDEGATSPSTATGKPGKGHGYVFRYRDPGETYSFNLRFAGRDDIETDELIQTLKSIIADLRKKR